MAVSHAHRLARLFAAGPILSRSPCFSPLSAAWAAQSSARCGSTASTTAAPAPQPKQRSYFLHGKEDIGQIIGNHQALMGREVVVGGWVRAGRLASKDTLAFVELTDGSSLAPLQLVLQGTAADLHAYAAAGASLLVRGRLQAHPGAKKPGQQPCELHVLEVLHHGPSDRAANPIAKTALSLEYLRTQTHLRSRTTVMRAVARIRNCLVRATHEFFQSRRFLHVTTPILASSDCEGGGALFQVGVPMAEGLDLSFLGRSAFLTVSGQLEAEAQACSLGSVYTFGPTFRAEPSFTPRHLAEFWMVEPELAFCDLAGAAACAEDYLRHCFAAAVTECAPELAWCEKNHKTGLSQAEALAARPFAQMTYTDAIAELAKASVDFHTRPTWGCDLQAEHERYLAERVVGGPLVVTNYPAAIKSFYMRANADGLTVAAMDILAPRVGELAGGSQREERLPELEARVAAMQRPEDYRAYLDLRRFGTVPHAGFGVGLERLVLLLTGLDNVRDVIPYPRAAGQMF